jgi:hypothetical protein
MGDRISISFSNGNEQSVALFSHWGGLAFKDEAIDYVRELKQKNSNTTNNYSTPMSRLEPCYVMVDFIKQIESTDSVYLGKDENDGDNSDNGHFVIDLDSNDYYFCYKCGISIPKKETHLCDQCDKQE